MTFDPNLFAPRSINQNPFPSNDAIEAQSGNSGSFTPASQTNATNTRATSRTGDNPFTAVLDHVASINNAIQGLTSLPPAQAPPSMPPSMPAAPPSVSRPPVQAPPPFSFTGPLHPHTTNVPSDPNAGGGDTGTSGGGVPPPNPAGSTPFANVPPPNVVGSTPLPLGTTGTDLFDANGVPWSATNRPPKPDNTENPEVAASWYRKHQWLDPSLAHITAADVEAYRVSGYQASADVLAKTPEGNNFIAWWQNGKPAPAQTPQTPANTGPTPGTWVDAPTQQGWNGTRFTLDQLKQLAPEQLQQMLTPEQMAQLGQATGQPPPTATPAAPQPGAPPAAPTTPAATNPAAPTAAAPTPPSSMDEITKLIDLFNSGKGPQQPPIEDMLAPMFARQRQKLTDEMRAKYAAQEAHSGGVGYNIDQAVSNLSGEQSAAMAGEMGQEYLAKLNQNTQLTQLATQAGMQKFLSDVNNDLERYKVRTNADLQVMLADKNNALAKYGIDSNDVLQRYLGKLGIDKANIDAKATVDAAALHAAAAEAGANASSAAAKYNADVNLQLGTGNLQVDREKNIGNFILGLLGLGQTGLGDLGNIFNNFPPGSVVVKP